MRALSSFHPVRVREVDRERRLNDALFHQDLERIRARKEGGPGWNSVEQKHFVKTFPDEDTVTEEVRQGFNPDRPRVEVTDDVH